MNRSVLDSRMEGSRGRALGAILVVMTFCLDAWLILGGIPPTHMARVAFIAVVIHATIIAVCSPPGCIPKIRQFWAQESISCPSWRWWKSRQWLGQHPCERTKPPRRRNPRRGWPRRRPSEQPPRSHTPAPLLTAPLHQPHAQSCHSLAINLTLNHRSLPSRTDPPTPP